MSTRPTKSWAIVTIAMALAGIGAAILLWLREPETRIVEVPSSQTGEPTEAMLARLAEIEAEMAALSDERIALLRQAAAFDCPPGTEPADALKFAEIKARAEELLLSAN